MINLREVKDSWDNQVTLFNEGSKLEVRKGRIGHFRVGIVDPFGPLYTLVAHREIVGAAQQGSAHDDASKTFETDEIQ
jgi:hypothetical protein